MPSIKEAMEARYPLYVYDEHLHLIRDDGDGLVIHSDEWPSGWGACPTIQTVLSWL